MVKKSKILFFFKCFIFIILVFNFFGCSKSLENNNEDFKVLQKPINLFPLNTLSVLGLNAYLVKNEHNLYLITLSTRLKKYNWLIDTIKVKKSLVLDYDTPLVLKDIPINLYLSQDIEILLQVKKINDTNIYQDTLKQSTVILELPYFIAVNNKVNDNIYFLKVNKIKVNLNNKELIKFSQNIKIKFNEKYIDELEILVGFKQTPESFSNLQNYILKLKPNKQY